MLKKIYRLYDKYNTAISIVLYTIAIAAWIFYELSFVQVAYWLAGVQVTATILIFASLFSEDCVSAFKKIGTREDNHDR